MMALLPYAMGVGCVGGGVRGGGGGGWGVGSRASLAGGGVALGSVGRDASVSLAQLALLLHLALGDLLTQQPRPEGQSAGAVAEPVEGDRLPQPAGLVHRIGRGACPGDEP